MTKTDDQDEFLTHFSKGRDPVYFAEVILGVKLNPAQKRWFNLALRTKKNGWEWAFRRGAHIAANQIGKTLGLAIAILWANNYKVGIPGGDWDSWLYSAYNWHHLAPQYTQSLYVLNDMRMLMEGNHPAQFDKDEQKFRRTLWRPVIKIAGQTISMAEEKTIDSTYKALVFWNGATVHFRTSDNKAKSLQGVRSHGISFDEAAFEDHLVEVLDQAVKLRLISTGGPLILVSTPNGINDYFQVVNDYMSKCLKTSERTWESEEQRCYVLWSHISDNIGYGYSEEEVAYLETDIDAATKEQQLRGAFLEPKDAFFVPISDIEDAFIDIPAEVKPQNDHNYIIFWDVSGAKGGDPTVCVVLDVTKTPMRGVYYRRWKEPMPFRELLSEIRRIHAYYTTADFSRIGRAPTAITGFDASSLGGVQITQELDDLHPLRPTQMTGSSRIKDEMLINLRKALSTKKLLLPADWAQAKREILSYRRDDGKLTQDTVMALAGAIKVAPSAQGVQRKVNFSVGRRTRHPTAFGR